MKKISVMKRSLSGTLSLPKCLSKGLAILSCVFLLAACGDDSGSRADSDEPVSSSSKKDSSKSSSITAKSSSSAKSSSADDWDDDEEMCLPPTIFGLAGEEGCSDPSILSSVKPAKQCKTEKDDKCEYGTMTDPRDGKKYKTVVIGEQTWMVDDLNYEMEGYKKGRYKQTAAMHACPYGWHLPSECEYMILMEAIGGSDVASKMLKSTTGWKEGHNGVDAFGFSAQQLSDLDDTYFWTSNFYTDLAITMWVRGDEDAHTTWWIRPTCEKYPVRCVKGYGPSDVGVERSSFKDSRDGQTYKTVKINEQWWMAENLNYESENSFCFYDNPSKCEEYGRHYTWAAAKTACPSGWHLPDTTEWNTLINLMGGKDEAGKILKSTSGWEPCKRYRTARKGDEIVRVDTIPVVNLDKYGFTVLPAGNAHTVFGLEGILAEFWTSVEQGDSLAIDMITAYTDDSFVPAKSEKNWKLSVRCIKD
ncbi:FISUMP domain-containing protein [Fibrobacter succinogenes]|uniref:FISUMP domain-containing protein n=1 Tax=Fibrobacter succinogenes TaxID=833 RepID=UPI001567E3C3|nr:FISUMP domain-containing protein [Fibrobacter succinogenes]